LQKSDMHILMIAPMPVWPVNAGERVRMWHLATGLAQHLQVTLIAPCYGQQDSAYAEDTICENLTIERVWLPKRGMFRVFQSVFTKWPYHTQFYYEKKIARTVKDLLATHRFSLIYCNFIHTLPYVIDGMIHADIPVILDPQNVDRLYWQRKIDTCHNNLLLRRFMSQNLQKTIRFEAQMLPYVSTVVSVSEQERRLTQQYAGHQVTHFWVATNGVNVDVYHPKPTEIDNPKRTAKRKLLLGFFGSMNLAINQDAVLLLVHEIYPIVKERLPDIDISVHIIGRNPPSKIRKLAHTDPSITVFGTVTDVLLYLHQIDLLVLPLQSGAGTKLRVLEAMASGVPVIGSPLAFAGLDHLILECHAVEATTITEFADAIERLAMNPRASSQMAHQAREFVVKHYQWSHITTQLMEQLIQTYDLENIL